MDQPFIERKYLFFTYARVILNDQLFARLVQERAHSYIVGVSHNKLDLGPRVSVRQKKTIIIQLDTPIEDIFRKFNDTARNEVRRTERMNDLVFTRNDGKWNDVYTMYKAHRKERGLPIHPLKFLQWGMQFNAYWQGRLISTITCYDAKPYLRIQNIFSRIAADDKELRRTSGFAARRLVYELCKFGSQNGYTLLDMASANITNSAKAGITRFKSSFGGTIADEYIYTYKGAVPRLFGKLKCKV
ncbi:MAG: hypothetical protein G01um101429_429 [Parcubacteria group bacterium Gr01-1014_29]|nr:MAG: hypothetical protein G01um101429_429 [Parcubacteria group bacterium Gr01-1014_29]